ncbi:alkaline phosphatase [Algoriphagus halophilus]|uniref:Alkaline phosphatase n=1 Tax=Algoriphagus halophilus TaxID=226505 RepID=A0A1N6D5C3_9BACT|nr:alkaline phosphatase [Algoriphagus halophilus]SIN65975.1 alkaline phosphatase [Algoriphagus halophilus]
MNKASLIFTILFFAYSISVLAQQESDFNIHSHNDYLQKAPFWEAFGAGASSIEVDVILQDGQLMAAHEKESIHPSKTIQSLYLDPIREGLQNGVIEEINFHLLVDLKTSALPTLEVLQEIMKGYQDLAYSSDHPKGLKLIISGNRPDVGAYASYPEWMFFDYQSKELTQELPWSKIGMVSLSFRQFSIWNGKGRMVEEQRVGLQKFIDLVHSFHNSVRFWGTPDSKTAWKAFYEMGVDFINTDHPYEAQQYLKNLTSTVYQNPTIQPTYTPKFELDGVESPVQNIILMIGDGNGLAQISSALFANGNALTLTNLKKIGLVKTQAADDFTTDSAAGATAYATGQKTNNRALGLGPNGEVLVNIPDILEDYGFNSGIITTDQLTGATPASFYAHHPERDDSEQIAAYLSKSKLDLFIGGGSENFSNEINHLNQAGFTIIEDFNSVGMERVGYFAATGSLPKMLEGRGDYLKKSTGFAFDFFEEKKAPFFLMIEAANIDSGGHSNSTSTIISEMLDFDQTIGKVLQFADEHPGTLVIITADHETGGVSIPQGDIANATLELAFHSDDHTGIMVPIFAYGAHSSDFIGVYENTEVFAKILGLVKKYHQR